MQIHHSGSLMVRSICVWDGVSICGGAFIFPCISICSSTTFPFSVCYECPRSWILAMDELPAGKLTMLCDANVHGVSTYTMSCQQILPEGCRCCWFCCVDSTEAKQARLLHTCKTVSGVLKWLQQEHLAIANCETKWEQVPSLADFSEVEILCRAMWQF